MLCDSTPLPHPTPHPPSLQLGDQAEVASLLALMRDSGYDLPFQLTNLANHMDTITVLEREGKVRLGRVGRWVGGWVGGQSTCSLGRVERWYMQQLGLLALAFGTLRSAADASSAARGENG